MTESGSTQAYNIPLHQASFCLCVQHQHGKHLIRRALLHPTTIESKHLYHRPEKCEKNSKQCNVHMNMMIGITSKWRMDTNILVL